MFISFKTTAVTGHTRQRSLKNDLHVGVSSKHLNQTSQSHTEDHVCGKHSQGCEHRDKHLKTNQFN